MASFTYSPEKPLVGETVTFDASVSTPNSGTITSYTWDFDDGSPIATETEPTTTHIYATYGTFNVTLTVTDSEGLTDTESKLITVYDPPVAAFTYAPTTPLVGKNVTFNASQSTDADGIIQSYFWDFDDGFTEMYVEGINLTTVANHAYASKGTYNVTLTVTDNDGFTNSTWRTVTVKRAAFILPSIEIIGLTLLIIAIIVLGLGAYVYIKRRKIAKS